MKKGQVLQGTVAYVDFPNKGVVKVEEGKFPLFKIVDEAVLKLEPSMRLRLMREFSNEELAIILSVVGDESAEIILRSLSVRLVNMILSYVESYAEVSPENIEKLLKNLS